ncbi:TTN [Mytilus edulis]|uniref:TTN n=1 Tax=Mytilus edulis TaxID=6550 RepID=A0A8S3TKC5_MYTED|nr:TTN [Mytilus edulis]
MLNQIHCFEGEQLQIECAVYSDNIPVEWFKNDSNRFQSSKIKENNNIIINRSGENHVLTIKNCKLCDAGLYTIQAGNVRKKTKVTIEAFFKRPLVDKTTMEGVEVSFECEAEKPDPVVWFKDNNEVLPSSEFIINTLNNTCHKLTIVQPNLADKGKYGIKCIKKKDISSCADLDVKGGQGQDGNPIYGSSSGRIWCTCRRRCRYREWSLRNSCILPFLPRYWRTCCKYLRNYQTSSMYRGYAGSTYPQTYPGSTYPGTYPGSTYPPTYPGSMYPQMSYPTYPGIGGGSLPPKGV